jgi:2'-5' RNA ligase
MKNKYNLALLPTLRSDELITFSAKFANIADQYLLGKNSLPHITLHQFEIEENKIASIWEKISTVWKDEYINIELSKFSYITFDKKTYWISLLPKNTEILHKMHIFIANTIRLPLKENYDPHLTLLNTKVDHYQSELDNISNVFHPISDKFILTLGSSDLIGQFTNVIYQKNS